MNIFIEKGALSSDQPRFFSKGFLVNVVVLCCCERFGL
uniref:Uncharacterized protein n=1 Tax=Anguilla anguilla TaxID=7936 RepID=A0A0E9TJI3_ANGAN